MPHELIRWTSRRSDQIAACLEELEHEYVTAVDDDGEPRSLPVVSERARAKLNRMAAKMTRLPKQTARRPRSCARGGRRAPSSPLVSPPTSSTPSSSTPAPQRWRSGPGSPPWSTSPWRPWTSPRRCSW
ncbi:hypothetical protein KJK32_46295 (plasmid) [Streptomyces sp. JCM17656]|nr:hypothetical protein KJK32_46295 [Streptomyces sp. JCM17656]